MTLLETKKYYSRFLTGHKDKLHFAAHSHHFWPDVSRDGHMEYWDHCALTSDEKWEKIFSEVIPYSQKKIAEILNLSRPGQISFAPNTHEFVTRILSLFVGKKSLRILTTSSEFHSWNRQITRLDELPEVNITRVDVNDQLIQNLKNELKKDYDLFYISHVFFDSGIALKDQELKELVAAKSESTIMVIDGYHAFAAIPTDLSSLEGKIFYVGGGYKYAQAGEGAGFLVVPEGDWRPAYTGWFAGFADLGKGSHQKVAYNSDGMSFMGATQDLSGLYRFNAVWKFFEKEGITIEKIHAHAHQLQKLFLESVPKSFLDQWHLQLISQDLSYHGHFLTYQSSSEEQAKSCENALKSLQVTVDRRGPRIRFGFGLYQDKADVLRLTRTLGQLAEKIQ